MKLREAALPVSLLLLSLVNSSCTLLVNAQYTSSYHPQPQSHIQIGELWLHPSIEGTGRSKDKIPLFAYTFEAPPYKAGIRTIDHAGNFSKIELTYLRIVDDASNIELFRSNLPITTDFSKTHPSGVQQRANCYYNLKNTLDPAKTSKIRFEATIKLTKANKTLTRNINTTFQLFQHSGVSFFEPIHD